MTFQFIADHAKHWPVTWMCDALEVSVSGYYAWAGRTESPAEQRRQELLGVIEEVHVEVQQRYGSPRMTGELRRRGFCVNHKRTERLMAQHGIVARDGRKRRVRT